jgi:hypothetical protein
MCGDGPWREIGNELSETDLRCLIKGLVLLGRNALRGAGSVSPVVPLFERYRARFGSSEEALGKWILMNRANPAEPFGSGKHPSVATWREYETAREIDDENVSQPREDDQVQHAEAQKRKAQKATIMLGDAVRRGDLAAVTSLLAKGADVHGAAVLAGMSMRELAQVHGRAGVLEFLVSQGIS